MNDAAKTVRFSIALGAGCTLDVARDPSMDEAWRFELHRSHLPGPTTTPYTSPRALAAALRGLADGLDRAVGRVSSLTDSGPG